MLQHPRWPRTNAQSCTARKGLRPLRASGQVILDEHYMEDVYSALAYRALELEGRRKGRVIVGLGGAPGEYLPGPFIGGCDHLDASDAITFQWGDFAH